MKTRLKHPNDRKSKKDLDRPAARASKEAKVKPYNPEGWPEFMQDLSESTISQFDFGRRMSINRKALEAGKVSVGGRVCLVKCFHNGRMVEAYHGAKGWNRRLLSLKESTHHVPTEGTHWVIETKTINNREQLQTLLASNEWHTSKMLESQPMDSFDFGNDDFGSFDGSGPNNEFIPMLGGPFSKQLYLTDYLDMQAKCFWIKNHHPLGKAIVSTLRNYVVGKGVKVLFKNPDCQKSWDDFCERVGFHRMLRSDVETLIWGGEIMTEKTKDRQRRPTLRQIDPSTVWEIVTDPIDIRLVFYYHQQYPTQWQLMYKNTDQSTEYVINDIPADKIIHVKENVTPGEKRGRSDLFSVISWLKRQRDWFNAKVVKAQLEESWALDIAIDGDQSDVDRIAADNQVIQVPMAGSTRVHNKDVVYTYLQPTSSSTSGRDNVGEQLITIIAVGAGMAPEWMGGGGGAASTRATAFVKESPSTRNIEDKQRTVEEYIKEIKDFVIKADQDCGILKDMQVRPSSVGNLKQAISKNDWKGAAKELLALTGLKDVTEPMDSSCEVIFPEFNTEDRSIKIKDIMMGEMKKYISHSRAATMYAQEMAINSYDPDQEKEDIDIEQESGIGVEWSAGTELGPDGKPLKPPDGKAGTAAAGEDDDEEEEDPPGGAADKRKARSGK